MHIGDEGDKFYIIVQGVVSVQIKNDQIKERMFKRREYDQLLKWKGEVFDPKVEKAKADFFENYQEEYGKIQQEQRL